MMMGTSKKLTAILTAALGFWIVQAHAQEDMVEIANDGFLNSRRAAAVFEHDVHNEQAGIDDCAECHHVYDESGNKSEDESSEDMRCQECHGSKAEGRTPGLMDAFHGNCMGCHVDQKAGPVMCGQCHRRR